MPVKRCVSYASAMWMLFGALGCQFDEVEAPEEVDRSVEEPDPSADPEREPEREPEPVSMCRPLARAQVCTPGVCGSQPDGCSGVLECPACECTPQGPLEPGRCGPCGSGVRVCEAGEDGVPVLSCSAPPESLFPSTPEACEASLVYVDPDTEHDARFLDGSREYPWRSLSQAQGSALPGQIILLAAGSTFSSSLVVRSGVHITGAYAPSGEGEPWSWSPENRVYFRPESRPPASVGAWLYEEIDAPTYIEHVDVLAPAGLQGPSIGLMVNRPSSGLVFSNSQIRASHGAPGEPGAPGASGAHGVAGADSAGYLQALTTSGDGEVPGAPGQANPFCTEHAAVTLSGAGGFGEAYLPNGSTIGYAGHGGSTGGSKEHLGGKPGLGSTPAESGAEFVRPAPSGQMGELTPALMPRFEIDSVNETGLVPVSTRGEDGLDGQPGSGGPGGGGMRASELIFEASGVGALLERYHGAPGASGGSGGCPGAGGQGGQDGWASIGVLVAYPSQVRFDNTRIASARGGDGAYGGVGGGGGQGGVGGAGSAELLPVPTGHTSVTPLAASGNGARGQDGGAGGPGAPGAPGASIGMLCTVEQAAGHVWLDGASQVTAGQAGRAPRLVDSREREAIAESVVGCVLDGEGVKHISARDLERR